MMANGDWVSTSSTFRALVRPALVGRPLTKRALPAMSRANPWSPVVTWGKVEVVDSATAATPDPDPQPARDPPTRMPPVATAPLTRNARRDGLYMAGPPRL